MIPENQQPFVVDQLMDEQATIKVYDPKVSKTQMQSDLNYLNTDLKQKTPNIYKLKLIPTKL